MIFRLFSLSILAASLLSGMLSAQINIALHNGDFTIGGMTSQPDGSVVKTSTDTWNHPANSALGLSFTHFALVDQSGTATSATLSVNSGQAGYNSNAWTSGSQDAAMMEGWYEFRDAESLTIANLPTSYASGYSVIIYGDSNDTNRTMDYVLGGVKKTIHDTGLFGGTFTEGANYVVYSGLTSLSFTLTGNTDSSGRSAINGMVILPTVLGMPPVITSFTTPDHYITPGTSVPLNWQVTGADTLSIDQAVGTVTGTTTNTTVGATTTYTLTASNEDGSTTATLKIAAGPPRPNILLFVIDDMGTQDTSEPFQVDNWGNDVPSTLNARFRTPSMEALAANGMKFTHAYAMPVCSPTRVSFMSGQNSARHHVTNWTSVHYNAETGNNTTPSHNSPLNWRRTGLDVSPGTLPSILSGAGYRSIHAGKAHFGNDPSNKDPINVGFDVNIAGSAIGHPGSYMGNYGQSTDRPVPGLEAYHNTGKFLTEALTLEMNKAIEDSVNDGVPFFAYMAHYAVHAPFQTDSRFAANYPTLAGNDLAFATMIEGMDKSLGDIVAKINSLGVGEDTLVIFISDNGSDSPSGSAPLRANKGSKYEGGSRVPMITAWAQHNPSNTFQTPLNIPTNTYEDDIVACFDIFPTILGVANVSHSDTIDGYDLRPYFKASPGSHRPQELLIHFPHDHRSDYFAFFRDGPYKLIYNFAPNTYELYNVVTDISEATDLSASDPDRVMAMARKMAIQLNEHGAQWPTFATSPTDTEDPFAMPILPGVDLDNDTIDDNAEDTNNNGIVDPGETNPDNDNSDGDNLSDRDEAVIGTDPLDANSYFKAEAVPQPDDTFQITWRSAPNATFTIRSSTDLIDWSTMIASGVIASAGTSTSYPLGNPSGPHAFYRVELE